MEYELKLLEMLGYKAIPVSSIVWNILDENDKIVGYISEKSFKRKKGREGSEYITGYRTIINSDTIAFKDTRRIEDDKQKFLYEFDVKQGESTHHVKMNIGEFPSIAIWSNEFGFMNLNLSIDEFYLNFKSKTPNYTIEETTVLKSFRQSEEQLEYNKQYSYCISYIHKDSVVDETKKINSRHFIVSQKPLILEPNQVELTEINWKNNKLVSFNKSIVDGTILEAVQINKMGIDSFNYFRQYLNKLLPFNQDVISLLTENYNFPEEEVKLFIPDIAKTNISNTKKLVQ